MKNEGGTPSKLQWNLNPKQWKAENSTGKPTGEICFPFVISFFFATAYLISFGIFFFSGTNDDIITSGVLIPICFLLSLCFSVIGFKRKKRDPNLRGKLLGVLSLLVISPTTPFLLFLLLYALPGELNGGCC